MTAAAFLLATAALLLAPGPTNALAALAAAQGDRSRLVPITAAALLGYVVAVVPLALLGGELVERWPRAPGALKLAAALWLLVLAARLWRGPVAAARPASPRAVFVTTLLNPKALIVALVLLPAITDPRFAAHFALFALTVIAATLVWGTLGTFLAAGPRGPHRTGLLERTASVWLALVSASLTAGTLTA